MDRKPVCRFEARKLFNEGKEIIIEPRKIKDDSLKEKVSITIDKSFKKKNDIHDFEELYRWYCANYCVSYVNGSYPVFFINKE